VTDLILRLDGRNPQVAEDLLPLVYDELRTIAAALFARQPKGHTLQPTAVVHEAWLKLAIHKDGWEGRTHFFSVLARAMRQVLADHARARRSQRRGGGWQRLSFDACLGQEDRDYDLMDVNDALDRLGEANPRHVRVVELRFFAGLTVDEIADLLGLSPRTIKLDERAARAWLRHALEGPRTT
jgi:RNA polymerase sigma-70 factor (ECF subfamily)